MKNNALTITAVFLLSLAYYSSSGITFAQVIDQPLFLSSHHQLKSDGITSVNESAITTEDTIIFKATLADLQNDQAKLQVELRQFSEPFTGIDDGGILESGFFLSGSQATIQRFGFVNGQYKWRVRAIDSQNNESPWQEFGTAGNIDFEVKLVPLYTQLESQFPPRTEEEEWADKVYANGRGNIGPVNERCGLSIGECGCAITSAVMLLRYHGITSAIDNKDANPLNINDWLNGNNGYVGNGDLDWLKVSEYSKNQSGLAHINYDKRINFQDTSTLNNYLDSFRPAVLYNSSLKHFLLADGRLAMTYTVKDPLFYNTKKLNEAATDKNNFIRDYNNQFDGLRLYTPVLTGGPIDGISFNLASPAEMLITDPSGRRLGKDPISNIIFNEIPNGSYDQEAVGDAFKEPPPQPPEVKNIFIPNPESGDYAFKVTGTATGTYTLNSLMYDDQNNPHSQIFSGLTQTNQITDFNITFTPSQPQDIKVAPADDIFPEASIFFDAKNLTLKVEGTDNIINPAPEVIKNVNTFTIIDAANNTTKLVFKKLQQAGNQIKAELQSLQYNDEQVIEPPKTTLNFEWALDPKTKQIRELHQKVDVKDQFTIQAKYGITKNETDIKIEKGKGKNKEKESFTLPGLVLVKLITEAGELNFELFTFQDNLSMANEIYPKASLSAVSDSFISRWFLSFMESIKAIVVKSLRFLHFYPKEQLRVEIQKHQPCLSEDEFAEYNISKKAENDGIADITVKEKMTNEEIFKFRIEISDSNHYHPIEMHQCGVYAIRTFGYDYKNKKNLEDYRRELWLYNYNGDGNSLLSDSAVWSYQNILGDFRISPDERYLVLQKAYFGSPDYAIVIKNIKTLDDIFVLPMLEIEKRNPDVVQDIIFNDWTRDGRYFWVHTHIGADTLGFIRIDNTDWSYELFKSPPDVLGGDKLNLENGWLTVHPGNIWFGISDFTKEEVAKRRARGMGTEFYIYNFFTKERRFIDKTDEPLWYFKPNWISDTELEYSVPSGERDKDGYALPSPEKKVYTINEK
ncbi:MAG TPA: hypothetical protein DCY97_17355 [Marinilabiliales bacterium]|nr:hypothetical protein [Marinilabiliales bacterium]